MAKGITSGKPRGKPRGKPFKKGVSPNPGGVPKGAVVPRRIDMDARLLARDHCVLAVQKLIDIMNNDKATHTAQIIAANSILDRGYGRPPQSVEVYETDVQADTGDGVIEIIESRLAELGERLRARGFLLRPEGSP